MTSTLHLGTGPRDEPTPTDPATALRVGRAYRVAFRVLLGDEPAGARLLVLPTLAGESPFELVCEFDRRVPEAAAYAAACDRAEIDTWAAAGLTDPIRRGTRSGQGR